MAQYQIKSGDTLSQIAQANNTTVANLQTANPQITNPNLIYAGQNLVIPADTLTNPPKQIVPPTEEKVEYPPITAPTTATDTTTDYQKLFDAYMKSTENNVQPDYQGMYNQAEQDSGYQQYLKDQTASKLKLGTYQAELQGIIDQTKQDQLKLKSEGISAGAISGRSIANERNAAIRAIPLQMKILSEQAILANNTELLGQAKEKLNTLFTLQSKEAENAYSYRQKLIDSVFSFANEKQKIALEEKKLQNERDFQLKRDELARQHDVEMANLNLKNDKIMANLNASLKPTTPSVTGGGVDANGNPIVNQQQLGVINDVNTIIDDQALTSMFGWGGILKRNMPGTAEYNLKANVNNLIDKLALAARGQLKGQGTVSDFEGKMLKNAQTALKFNMEPAQAMQQLLNIRGAIATSSGLTATVEIKDLASGKSQLVTADQAGIQKAIQDGLLVTYK